MMTSDQERAAPAQQPVAWRWRVNYRDDWCWSATQPEFSSSDLSRGMVSDVHPLYDHPSSEPELRAEIASLKERLANAYRAKAECNDDANWERHARLAAESRVEALSAEVGTARAAAFEEAAQIAEARQGYDDNLQRSVGAMTAGESIAAAIRSRAALTRAESSLASPAGMEGWMPMETVYVVGGTVGEWSDRSEWTVGVWVSEADAKAFVEKISALGRIFEQAMETRNNDDWSDESEAAVAKAEADCREVDPGWSDYCGDAPHYTVWPEKLIFPAAPRGESE